MIVDLMRSELGRVAVPGSVAVASLCAIERYPTLLQMTSTVTATARPGTGLVELFGALFPSGSVTGAPKASTMRLIAALEGSPRGVYCGAIGVVAPGGDAVFSVPIRTAVVDRESGRVEYGAGAGITWGSEAAAEYREVLLKAAVLGEPPSRDCGLLGGVLRGELLARGAIAERVLRPGDLRRAASVWLVSSLRGEVRVHFAAQ